MGMIDVVYAVGPYSKYGDAELRYSLRSLEMHGRGLRDLWIIGHCPEWICPDHHLRIPDFSGNPHACTALKVLVACAQPELTEQFVFMSDDFFIGKDVDLIELPHYYLGTLSRVAVHHGGAYQQALRNTAAALSGRGYPTNCYEAHAPMRIERDRFGDTLRKYEWEHPRRSHWVLWRSLYANTLRVKGVFTRDVKLFSERETPDEFVARAMDRGPFFSTEPHLSNAMIRGFDILFPTPSRWEVPLC